MKNLLASTILLLATASFAVVPNLLECTGEGIALSYLENDGRFSLRLVDGKKAVKIDSVAGIISTPSPLGTLITAIDQIFPSETHYVSFVMPRINFMSGQTSMPVITSLIEHVSRVTSSTKPSARSFFRETCSMRLVITGILVWPLIKLMRGITKDT